MNMPCIHSENAGTTQHFKNGGTYIPHTHPLRTSSQKNFNQPQPGDSSNHLYYGTPD